MRGNAILCTLAKMQKMKQITVKKKNTSIDNKLTFSSHIRELCKKASQKISALPKQARN